MRVVTPTHDVMGPVRKRRTQKASGFPIGFFWPSACRRGLDLKLIWEEKGGVPNAVLWSLKLTKGGLVKVRAGKDQLDRNCGVEVWVAV